MIFSMSAKKQSSLLFDAAKSGLVLFICFYQEQLMPTVFCKNNNTLQPVGARARRFLEVLTENKMLVVWRSHRN